MSGRQTVMFLFEKDGAPPDLRLLPLFGQSVGFAACGIAAGALLFPSAASLVGVFLIALGQARTVHSLLDRNREQIFQQGVRPRRANWALATGLSVVFAGIFCAYAVAARVLPQGLAAGAFASQVGDYGGQSLAAIHFEGFGDLLGHNLLVALVGFLFALLYRHGGLLLVLAWNASVWGVVFPWLARTAPDAGVGLGGALVYLGKTLVAIAPHLGLEALAYVLVATAGVFASKILMRHEWGSLAFRQATGAAARIAALGVAALTAAAALEAWLTPLLVAFLF